MLLQLGQISGNTLELEQSGKVLVDFDFIVDVALQWEKMNYG